MKIAITGATGFIGEALSAHLRTVGHEVYAISTRGTVSPERLAGCEAVVNLAGEPVSQRWTKAAKERIRSSRVEGTRALVEGMKQAAKLGRPPQAMVSASAVGYYGSRGDEVLLESEPAGEDFLGQVAAAWEREAMGAEVLGTRVTRVRFGVVLGRDSKGKPGGALKKMLPPFRLGLGGRLGSGEQWTSWIHLRDLVRMIEFLIKESTVRGVFNGVAPNPVTNREFTRALAEAVNRLAVIPVPGFALKLALGEMSRIVLDSQRAVPDAAVRAGFTFDYTDVFGALAEVVGGK